MKKYLAFPILAAAGGAGGFALRLAQNRTGFESDTGLPIAGNPYAPVLIGLLVVLAAVFVFLARMLPGERTAEPRPFETYFRGGTGARMMLALGIFTWLFSGVLGLYAGVTQPASRAELILGVLTLASALCLFPLIAVSRPDGDRTVSGGALLTPVICLVIRLVITYREDSVNPALSAYYVDLLALALLLLCLYRTASFAFGDGKTRRLTVYASMGAVLSMTTLGDSRSAAGLLFYAGGALLCLGLLCLRLQSGSRAASAQDAPGEER
ncbi:MAG: hypothetical protein LKJ86_05470 [Oscillibacter sp.]|nr:hypothetical protein [Oscillibacter sp.]